MSRNIKNVQAKKPYCKICHDAGKSDYNSHWVKDSNGKVLCPTLLNTECRYCFKMGHTIKFCDILLNKNKKKEEPTTKNVVVKPQKSQVIQTNTFEVLQDENDSDNESDKKEVDNFPSLDSKLKQSEYILPKVIFGGNNWAHIAAKPKQEVKIEEKEEMLIINSDYKNSSTEKPIQKPIYIPSYSKHKSWADWSDSEDEDEEEKDVKLEQYSYEQCDDSW